MKRIKPTYKELEKRLAAAESIVEALKHHEVDAVVGEKKIAFLLLREVTETLLDSEAGFRAMFELAGVGMFQADSPSFRFSRVNQKFCDIMGYSTEELLAKTYIGITHPHDHQRDTRGLTHVLLGEANSWSIDKRCVRKDGKAVRVSVNAAVLRDESGRAVRIMGMIGEVTARQAADTKPPEKHKPGRR
jgi:PAS domain S-box-containing protein